MAFLSTGIPRGWTVRGTSSDSSRWSAGRGVGGGREAAGVFRRWRLRAGGGERSRAARSPSGSGNGGGGGGGGGGVRKSSGKTKAGKRRERRQTWSGTNTSTELPLEQFDFLDGQGGIKWEVLQRQWNLLEWEREADGVHDQTLDHFEGDGIEAPAASPAIAPEASAAQALYLSRTELLSGPRHIRRCSLGALGVFTRDFHPATAAADASMRRARTAEPVLVVLAVTPETDGDMYVRGRVRTRLRHQACDRCSAEVDTEIRNSFDVWLATRTDGVPRTYPEDPRVEEAVEVFHPGIEGIDFTAHVRDAVNLGVPLRTVCTDTAACRARMHRLGWRTAAEAGVQTTDPRLISVKGMRGADGDDRLVYLDKDAGAGKNAFAAAIDEAQKAASAAAAAAATAASDEPEQEQEEEEDWSDDDDDDDWDSPMRNEGDADLGSIPSTLDALQKRARDAGVTWPESDFDTDAGA